MRRLLPMLCALLGLTLGALGALGALQACKKGDGTTPTPRPPVQPTATSMPPAPTK